MDAGAGSIKLFFCILLVILGAYFASAETSFARANKIKLRNIADDGDKRGKKALHVINRFEKALVTILIGNNIAHLACSSLATLAAIDFFGEGHTLEATIVTTLVVFFFSETLPKSFANANSEKTALAYASSMSFLMKILTPVCIYQDFRPYVQAFRRRTGRGYDRGRTRNHYRHRRRKRRS